MSFLRLLLVSCLALVLGACEPTSGRTSGAVGGATRLAQIVERGELRVGLSGSQPPLNMRNRAGEIVGLEVDLVTELANSMGLEARFEAMEFAELLPALEAGKVDLVASGMTITPDRNARVAFAGPYVISGKSLLTKSEDIADVEAPEALNLPDRSYAALAGSTSEAFVKNLLPASKLVATPDYDAAVKMVLDDEVDALIADLPICSVSVLRHPEAGFFMLVSPFTIEPLGIALPADDPLFVNLVQNYLTTLDQTGFLIQLKAKWFNDGDWLDDLP
jgi:polar amino acid transport system substrate-binding protein